jgi:Flp pilus assembly protein TadG
LVAGFLIVQWRALRGFWDNSDGAALVESAIILPVFLALVGGVLEFGFYLYQEEMISSGVRDATRYLTLTADPSSAINQSRAKNLAVTGSVDGEASPRIAGWTTSDISVSVDILNNESGNYGGAAAIEIITVSTRVADSGLGFFGLLGIKKPAIDASYQQRFIGGAAQQQ